MNKEEVLKLAKLARVGISNEEAETLSHEFDAILGYVSEIKNAKLEARSKKLEPVLVNVMREDVNPHESGVFTEDLLNEVPNREGSYVKVKKIL
ncbi:MAG: Asp-tRNA(Asn)/Glu-tRNA(Gln) amidotransferase subunit GatC [Patescibacteria group bacterium]